MGVYLDSVIPAAALDGFQGNVPGCCITKLHKKLLFLGLCRRLRIQKGIFSVVEITKMINVEALEKVRILEQKYKETWGINVDYTIIPSEMTQEKLVDVLERIVETGESISAGFSNIKNKHNK